MNAAEIKDSVDKELSAGIADYKKEYDVRHAGRIEFAVTAL